MNKQKLFNIIFIMIGIIALINDLLAKRFFMSALISLCIVILVNRYRKS